MQLALSFEPARTATEASPRARPPHPVFTMPRGPFCYGCLRYAPPECAPREMCPRCRTPLSTVGMRSAP